MVLSREITEAYFNALWENIFQNKAQSQVTGHSFHEQRTVKCVITFMMFFKAVLFDKCEGLLEFSVQGLNSLDQDLLRTIAAGMWNDMNSIMTKRFGFDTQVKVRGGEITKNEDLMNNIASNMPNPCRGNEIVDKRSMREYFNSINFGHQKAIWGSRVKVLRSPPEVPLPVQQPPVPPPPVPPPPVQPLPVPPLPVPPLPVPPLYSAIPPPVASKPAVSVASLARAAAEAVATASAPDTITIAVAQMPSGQSSTATSSSDSVPVGIPVARRAKPFVLPNGKSKAKVRQPIPEDDLVSDIGEEETFPMEEDDTPPLLQVRLKPPKMPKKESVTILPDPETEPLIIDNETGVLLQTAFSQCADASKKWFKEDKSDALNKTYRIIGGFKFHSVRCTDKGKERVDNYLELVQGSHAFKFAQKAGVSKNKIRSKVAVDRWWKTVIATNVELPF